MISNVGFKGAITKWSTQLPQCFKEVECRPSIILAECPGQAIPGDILVTKETKNKPSEVYIILSDNNGKKRVYCPLSGKTKKVTDYELKNNIKSGIELNASI